jgi:hypothetical protein
MGNKLKWFLSLFKSKCPDCNLPMSDSFFDMERDVLVQECGKCKKEWM